MALGDNCLNLTSTDANLNISSSYLTALNNINLNARKGGINITADTDKSDSFSRNFAFTISIPLIGKGGAGSIYFAKSKSESESYVNSVLTATNQFNLNSKEDTNIISSNILASDINMIVGGNLNIESKQNTSRSKATSFGIGGGYSDSGGGKSGSGNLSYSKSTSNRSWVDNQASILGTNSVTINVGETTNLIGSVIANSTNGKTTNDGIDGGNLTLNTKYLTHSNLQDTDEARSFGIGVAGSVRSGGGQGSKGSGSLSLDYAMHDYKQDTNATIGQGTIKVGTSLNLDSDNNLVSVDGGINYGDAGSEDYLKSGLNRSIQTAQVTTKHLEVNPIAIKETFEFGRNSTESQMKSSNSTTSGRPTIWNDLNKTGDDKTTLQSTGSMISSIGSGILANAAITLKEFIYQINPLRGFSNITDGISTDLKNMRTELGIETKVLDVGQDRQFITLNKDGTKQIFTLADLILNPDLAANKLFSNGIMNNESDAIRNAKTQLGASERNAYDQDGRITILFDPTAAPNDQNMSKSQKFFGFMSDLGEVSINYLGANILGGAIQTKGQKTDQDFINLVTDNAKLNGDLITLAGHSGGGLRNYLALVNSSQGQYLDGNGNSVLQVQFSGTPGNNFDMIQVSNYSGAKFLKVQNNSGDTVGLVLGMNGSIVDAISGTLHILNLFEPKVPFTEINLKSSHSDYGCNSYWCNNKGDIGSDLKNYITYPSLMRLSQIPKKFSANFFTKSPIITC